MIFLIASVLVNGANFSYHLIVSRRLDTDAYGALGALLGLLLIFSVPAGALQVAVTKDVAQRRLAESGKTTPIVIGPLLAQSLLWGLGIAAVLLLAAPLFTKFLHLDSVMEAVFLALYAIPSTLAVVPKGVLLGELRFGLVSLAMVAGSAVRLGLGAYLSETRGLEGALAAILLGDLVTVAIMLPALRKFVAGPSGVAPLRVHWKEGTSALIAFSGFWAMTGVDTLLARHFLERGQSGFYAAAATAARSALFMPSAVASIALPRFAVGAGRSQTARSALMRSLVVVALMGIGAVAVLGLFSDLVVKILFGARYVEATEALLPLAIAASALGFVSVLMHFHIAANARMAAAFPWIGVAIASVGILFFHDSMLEIAISVLVSSLFVLVLMGYVAFGRQARERHHAEWVGAQHWDDSKVDLDITMVVPYFNPGPDLITTIKRLDEALTNARVSYEIIAVSDGSTDGSAELLDAENIPSLRAVTLPHNMGKGHALRNGMAMGRGRYIGFIDADGDVDPRILAPYMSLVQLYQPDVVLGSKRHPMSEVHYPPLRHVYSWGYQMLTYLLFRTKVRDTQTGLKLVRREVLALALPLMEEKRFAFDLELLVVAKHLGFSRFFEAPIKIDFQFRSTVSAGSVRGMLLDTFAIFYRLHLLRSYDPRDPEQSVAEETEAIQHQTPAATQRS